MIPLGYPEDSLQILQEGEKVAKELADGKSLAILYSRMGHYYTVKGGDPLLGRGYTEKCFQEADRIQDIEIMAPISCDLCISNHIVGDYLKTLEIAPGVIGLLQSQRRESESFGRAYSVHAALHVFQGHSLGMLGDFGQGEELCEEALRLAVQLEHPYTLALVELFYGAFLFAKGDGERVREHLQCCLQFSEQCKAMLLLGFVWTGLGAGHYFLGELDAARELIEKGLKIQSDARIPALLSLHYYFLGMVCLDLGEVENARNLVLEALRLAGNNHEKWMEGASYTLLGRIVWEASPSQHAEAERSVLQGIRILEEAQIRAYAGQGYLFLGELYAHEGRRAKARKNLEKARGMFDEMGMDYWRSMTQNVLNNVSG